MAHTIQMTVTASLKDGDLIHRILNFKEDVQAEIIQGRYGVVADPTAMDRALAPVTITIPRKRHYDHLSPFVVEALRRHEVSHAVQITESHS